MNIQITDHRNDSTVIGSGSRPPSRIIAASQIDGWSEQRLVTRGGTDFTERPFAVGGGDCLFNTDSLFCFAGARNVDSDNTLMVL
jgi:hypothetical protein